MSLRSRGVSTGPSRKGGRRRPLLSRSTAVPIGWRKTIPSPANAHDPEKEQDSRTAVSVQSVDPDVVVQSSSARLRTAAAISRPPGRGLGDPFNSTVVPLDAMTYQILHYYITDWIPVSKNQATLAVDSTPLTKLDHNWAIHLIRLSMLQGPQFRAYCLLASTACRMKYFSHIQIRKLAHPEALTLKSVQALRAYLAAGGEIRHHLIIDLYYLSFAEFYAGNITACRTHWHAVKQVVDQLGGFANLVPQLAWFILAGDYLFAAATLSLLVFNPIMDPSLQLSPPEDDIETPVADTLGKVKARFQVLIRDNISIAEVIAVIRLCPESDVVYMRGYLKKSYGAFGNCVMVPALHHEADVRTRQQDERAALADIYFNQARRRAFGIWLWYTFCGLAQHGIPVEASLIGMRTMARHTEELYKLMKLAEDVLVTTAWTIRPDLALWMHALGFIATSNPDGEAFFRGSLTRLAVRARLNNYQEFTERLSNDLPFDRLPPHLQRRLQHCFHGSRNEEP